VIVSEKLDGGSLDLRYENGWLKRAVTRGDGETGEDITRNVLLMLAVPAHIEGSPRVSPDTSEERSSSSARLSKSTSPTRPTAATRPTGSPAVTRTTRTAGT